MLIPTLIALFLVHWIGDFLFQSRWMGTNKSHSWYALWLHVLTYSATLFIFGAIYCIAAWKFHPIISWVSVNGTLHFVTDAITSRITSKLYERQELYRFWAVIGLDQFIHIVTLTLTLPLLIH